MDFDAQYRRYFKPFKRAINLIEASGVFATKRLDAAVTTLASEHPAGIEELTFRMFELVISLKQYDVLQYLLDHPDVNPNWPSNSAFDVALYQRDPKTLEIVVAHPRVDINAGTGVRRCLETSYTELVLAVLRIPPTMLGAKRLNVQPHIDYLELPIPDTFKGAASIRRDYAAYAKLFKQYAADQLNHDATCCPK